MAYRKYADFEKLVCQVLFQADSSGLPASFYLGLGVGVLPAAGATLASITEVSGSGYSRLQLQRNATDWPTLALASGAWKVTSKLLHWAATADWTGSNDFVFLTNVASGTSGKLYFAATIDSAFRMFAGDTFDPTVEYQDL